MEATTSTCHRSRQEFGSATLGCSGMRRGLDDFSSCVGPWPCTQPAHERGSPWLSGQIWPLEFQPGHSPGQLSSRTPPSQAASPQVAMAVPIAMCSPGHPTGRGGPAGRTSRPPGDRRRPGTVGRGRRGVYDPVAPALWPTCGQQRPTVRIDQGTPSATTSRNVSQSTSIVVLTKFPKPRAEVRFLPGHLPKT